MSLTQLPAPGAGAGRGVTQECAWGRWEAVRRQSQAGAASQSRQERPRDETLFVVGLFSSIPSGVRSPFPLPSPQRTLVGKMWLVRTSLLRFWVVTEGRDGSCPQQGSPDTSISHSCDFPAVDVSGGAFFCLSWSEELCWLRGTGFPLSYQDLQTPAPPLEEPGGADSSQPVPCAPQPPWQGVPVLLREHPPAWEAPSLELSQCWTHRTSKHRESSRYHPSCTSQLGLGHTSNLCPPLLAFSTGHHLPPSLPAPPVMPPHSLLLGLTPQGGQVSTQIPSASAQPCPAPQPILLL